MGKQKADKTRWTLVQHSAAGYKGDPQFAKGLEVREVEFRVDQRKVEEAGGVLFDTYIEASDAADDWPYVDNDSLIPNAQGEFAQQEIDGLRIYIPVRKILG